MRWLREPLVHFPALGAGRAAAREALAGWAGLQLQRLDEIHAREGE